jgi:hypothetical protein
MSTWCACAAPQSIRKFLRTWVALKRGVIMADTCPGRDRTATMRNQKGSMGREETAPQTRMQRSRKGTQPRDPRSVVLGVVLDRQEGWHHFQIWARNSRKTHRPGGMRGGGKGGWRCRAAYPSGQFLVSLSIGQQRALRPFCICIQKLANPGRGNTRSFLVGNGWWTWAPLEVSVKSSEDSHADCALSRDCL